MKKISIVLALALVLVFAFAVNAMAEQSLITPNSNTLPGNTADSYAATPFQGPTSTYNNGFSGALDSTTRIHSNYQLNSNACAACHAIHTGVGAYLLQWTDGQATCEACHDGTSKTYDVFGGQIAQTGQMTYGGRFNAHSSTNGSIHNVEGVDGTVILGAAPGGNRAPQTAIADASQYVKDAKNTGNTGDSVMAWGTTFECLSCHDPHGKAGNGRILNPNVNNYSVAYQIKTTTDSAAVLYQVTAGDNTVFAAKNKNNQFVWMNDGYPFSISVYDATGNKLTQGTDFNTDNASGFTKIVFAADPGYTPKATYFPGVKVNMVVDNYLQSTETVTYNQGINTFCGACHVDYNTEASTLKVNNTTDSKALYTVADSATRTGSKDQWKVMVGGGAYKILTGTYNTAYRHSVGFTGHAEVDSEFGVKFEHRTAYKADGTPVQLDVFNCLSCHVGHGADETVWSGLQTHVNAQSGSVQNYEGYNGSEVDPRGSFLTRMPNRGVCQTCHNMKAGNQGMAY